MLKRLLAPFVSLISLITSACASTAPAEAAEPIALNAPALQLDGTRYRETRVGRHIDAPPEVVWAVLTDAAAYPSWNSTIISLDGTIAQGETIELKAKIDPKRTFKLEVSKFDAPRTMVWQDGGRAFKGVRTFTLSPGADGGTDVTMAEVMTGTMMGMIAGKLPDFRPPFDTFLADLEVAAKAKAAG